MLLPPKTCGDFLIVTEGRRLTVRSAKTGEVRGKTSYEKPPVVACVDADRVVVGERRLRMASIPSLKLLWVKPISGSSVSEVVATSGLVAYRVTDRPGVVLLPLAE